MGASHELSVYISPSVDSHIHPSLVSFSLSPSLPPSLSPRLKAQQGLLVDFAAFPQKFIDLLDLCLSHADQERPK